MKTPLLAHLRQAFRLIRHAQLNPEKSIDDLLGEYRQYRIDRRRFLRAGLQSGALLGLGGPSLGLDLLGGALGKPRQKIAIVGAGLGGMSAGYFLRRKRVEATIFEGDKRAGGRVKSARIFAGGALNTEIGAEFIDTHHGEMLRLVRAIGKNPELDLIDVEKDLFGERDAYFFENRHHSLQEVLADLKDVYPQIEADRKKLDGRAAAALDRLSMAEYIDRLALSPWVKNMIGAAFLGENGLDPGEQSAANLLSIFEIKDDKFYPFGASDERFKVAGGNELVPKTLAEMLAPQMRYEHRLIALRENHNRSITLTFSTGGGASVEETFDVVILTLPFTVLREVDIRMELPPLKRRVIDELGYGTNAKFILETRDRPWRNHGYRGYLFNEQIPNGWDSAQMQNDNAGAGTFTCYFGGAYGRAAVRGTEQAQLEHVLPALEGAFPGSRASLTGKMELAPWPSNPFVKGSYSCFKPGQATTFEGVAFEPVRNLYFAGEHTSIEFWGFMNGAAETGRRVAGQLLKKVLSFSAALLLSLAGLPAQPATFSSRGVGGGGALFFPSVNPANDQEFYVACDMSQLFHSTDFGNNYSQLHFNALQVFNRSTYEFTKNPAIAYSIFNDGNDGYPVKTTDGGQTWPALAGYDAGQYGAAYKLSVHYDQPGQLLLNAYGDILFSNDGGQSFSLVKHTVNNGAGIVMGGVLWDGNNIYIGTNEGLLRSTNGGASFSVLNTTGIPAGQVIWSFAGARTGAATRFVCITASVNDVYNGLQPYEYYEVAKGVYTMDNADGNWVSKSAGIDFSNDFVMYAAMARNNTDVIYLGGNDNVLGAPLVLKSANGGNAWAKVFKTENNANIATGWSGYQGDKNWGWGETCFGISVAPNNADKVLFGDFGFVHLSADGGAHWKQAYVRNNDQHPAGSPTPKKQNYHGIGLENTTCWQVFWVDANTMMGCFSDIGGIRSADGGQSWGFTYNGFSVNSVYRMVKAPGGTLYAACSNVHDLYQSTYLTDARLDVNDSNGKIVFSTDNGLNWSTLKTFSHPVFWLAADPNNPNRLYASVVHFGGAQGAQQGGIYVTDNLSAGAAATWNKLPNPPRTEGHPACIVVLNDGSVLCSFSGRRSASGFTPSSGVFLYNPSNGSWADRSDPGMHYWTKDVMPDPSDPAQNTWYAAVFSGWGGAPNGKGGLYRSTNRGLSWTKLTGTQFDRVTSLNFTPQNLKQAYLTTETQGLWVTQDIGAATPVWKLVDAYPFRQPERVYFNPFNAKEMWVSSFGNGMRVGNLSSVSTSAPSAVLPEIRLWPNPAAQEVTLRFEAEDEQVVQIQFIAADGMAHTWAHTARKGPNEVPIRLTGIPSGVYSVSLLLKRQALSAGQLVVER